MGGVGVGVGVGVGSNRRCFVVDRNVFSTPRTKLVKRPTMPSFSRPANSSFARLIDLRGFSPRARSAAIGLTNITEATNKHELTNFILKTVTNFFAFCSKDFQLRTDA